MVVWPASLQQLTFGIYSNMTIDGVVWPASLQQLNFECVFSQTIDGHTTMSIDLFEAISGDELLKRSWQHDLVDRPIKMIPEREMLERCWPHDPVDHPVETSS